MPHLYSERGLQKKRTRAVALSILPDMPLQRPLGRLCCLHGPFLLISIHVFSPAWPNNCHTYKPASEPPPLAHIPAEFLSGRNLTIAAGLGCSPVLPLFEWLLLDREVEQTGGLIMTLGQRDGSPL